MRTVYPSNVPNCMGWRSPCHIGYSSAIAQLKHWQPKAKAVVEPQS
ncbi:MAG: hypothetical protein HC878_02400 [Leptolyngbyaceae cyanobacterium SL_5_14]|nr:hypothetical protein [Leptolyngbyaceae cyanobacterium SL_5_14]